MATKVSVSIVGASWGALAGAVVRPALIIPYLWPVLNGQQLQFAIFVSVGIGGTVGAIAGLIGKPLVSAIAGACLACAAYLVTMFPIAFCVCLAVIEQGGNSELPHPVLVGLTGALSGFAGGLAESYSERSPNQPDADAELSQPGSQHDGDVGLTSSESAETRPEP